jgi:DNA-binding transcriptional MerR regulator
METLPLSPGAVFNVDSWRRRLLAYLTDATTIRERFKDEAGGPPPYWLIVLDDIHHICAHSKELLGALLQMSTKAPLRLVMISRTSLDIYDRRDVHTRNIVCELSLKGLSLDEVGEWLESFEGEDVPSAGVIHDATGGHPLAMELLELYGTPEHEDWLRFLDEEIIIHMPKEERNLLATLAQSAEPIVWQKLAEACQWEGEPPKRLISHGLLMELEGGMWLHEALRERLLREVGEVAEKRRKRLD